MKDNSCLIFIKFIQNTVSVGKEKEASFLFLVRADSSWLKESSFLFLVGQKGDFAHSFCIGNAGSRCPEET